MQDPEYPGLFQELSHYRYFLQVHASVQYRQVPVINKGIETYFETKE